MDLAYYADSPFRDGSPTFVAGTATPHRRLIYEPRDAASRYTQLPRWKKKNKRLVNEQPLPLRTIENAIFPIDKHQLVH